MRVPAVRAKARPPECELPHGRPRPTVLCCRRTSRGCPMRRREIKGKKRHILVDTLGLLLHAIVHPADIQDRDGGILLLATLFGMYPFLKTLFADGGYQGPQFATALAKVLPHLDVEIVKRSDRVSGFAVLPKRWIVERSIAWLNRCRRLAKDWENLNRSLMLRKLCNPA